MSLSLRSQYLTYFKFFLCLYSHPLKMLLLILFGIYSWAPTFSLFRGSYLQLLPGLSFPASFGASCWLLNCTLFLGFHFQPLPGLILTTSSWLLNCSLVRDSYFQPFPGLSFPAFSRLSFPVSFGIVTNLTSCCFTGC